MWYWFLIFLVRCSRLEWNLKLFSEAGARGVLIKQVFFKKGVLRNFAKFTRKRLCQSLLFNKVAEHLSYGTPLDDCFSLYCGASQAHELRWSCRGKNQMGKLITAKTHLKMFECGNKNVKFSKKENYNFKANTIGRKTLFGKLQF